MVSFSKAISNLNNAINNIFWRILWATLKKCLFPITLIAKKKRKVTRAASKIKLNITFCFRCYLHHNCIVNLNWNNMQLYSSAKPSHIPSSAFRFVDFCFLPFLHRTSIQRWKENWWIGKKEMSAKISKCLYWNQFIGATAQIRAVIKSLQLWKGVLPAFKFQLKSRWWKNCQGRSGKNIICPRNWTDLCICLGNFLGSLRKLLRQCCFI